VIGAPSQSEPAEDEAATRFAQQEDGSWHLINGETSDQECKAQFDPKRMERIIRTIAAMANSKGGYIFIGVDDAYKVCGIPDSSFHDTDIARITDKVKTLLTPTPDFTKRIITVGMLEVGIIEVMKYPRLPVIVCKDADGLEDGAILYRYGGQSGKIKFGDLLEMLRERDQAAQKSLLQGAARLSDIGSDSALIVDADKGELDAGNSRFAIDQGLANQLKFIREGEFDERSGSPTLKLIGDVKVVSDETQIVERVEERAITPDDALMVYLNHEQVTSPLEYLHLPAFSQSKWLPLFYFVRLASIDANKAVEVLKATDARNKDTKSKALRRLQGDLSAYKSPGNQNQAVVSRLVNGEVEGLRKSHTTNQLLSAFEGLPDGTRPLPILFDLLKELFELSKTDPNRRSRVFKAAARLDELEREASQAD